MTKVISLMVLLLWSLTAQAQTKSMYDKELAETLGGDEYGMKLYTFVILKTGPKKIEDKAVVDSLFRGHMANIEKLAEAGKLVVAGPMKKNEKSYRGIFILDVKTDEEAKRLMEGDPAISEQLLEAEIYQWYGSAALREYLKYHDRIQEKKM